jgi:hypothetical protein
MDGGTEELVKEAYKDFYLFAKFLKHAATIGQLGENTQSCTSTKVSIESLNNLESNGWKSALAYLDISTR